MSRTRPLIRLALRIEGDWWVAYLAAADTMAGATRLGSILMDVVSREPEHKAAFMELMMSVCNKAIEAAYNQTPTWSEPTLAPEAERAGRA